MTPGEYQNEFERLDDRDGQGVARYQAEAEDLIEDRGPNRRGPFPGFFDP
jgi:hypothetical protein